MPSRDTHLAQAQHNEDFINLFGESDTEREFNDWFITAGFYTAVHYIEALLAHREIYPHFQHSPNHTDRNHHLRRAYREIWQLYWPLYNASMFARYLSHDGKEINVFQQYMSTEDVQDMIDNNLTTIKGTCLKGCGLLEADETSG